MGTPTLWQALIELSVKLVARVLYKILPASSFVVLFSFRLKKGAQEERHLGWQMSGLLPVCGV